MTLRQFIALALAAVLGAVISTPLRSPAQPARQGGSDRVVTHELVVLNDNGRPAVTLAPSNDGTVLRFFGDDAKPALEVGVAKSDDSRFIHFFGKKGEIIAALNSLRPNGESTLYLGDERWEARVILGALRSDTDYGKQNINDWGLQFREPGTQRVPIGILVQPSRRGYEAGIRIDAGNGAVWTAP